MASSYVRAATASSVRACWRISRVSDASTFATEPLAEPLPRDEEWETIVRVALRPRSDPSAEQQAAREEYGSTARRSSSRRGPPSPSISIAGGDSTYLTPDWSASRWNDGAAVCRR